MLMSLQALLFRNRLKPSMLFYLWVIFQYYQILSRDTHWQGSDNLLVQVHKLLVRAKASKYKKAPEIESVSDTKSLCQRMEAMLLLCEVYTMYIKMQNGGTGWRAKTNICYHNVQSGGWLNAYAQF